MKKRVIIIFSFIGVVASMMAQTRALQLPEVPDSLTEVRDRADYVSLHFWDAMDFADEAMCMDEAVVEQAFVDFINILSMGDVADQAIRKLVDKASVNKNALRLVSDIAEKYLYQTDSPFLDETMYAQFLNACNALDSISSAEKMRNEYKLQQINLCVPGSLAPDIALRGGENLLDMIGGKPAILLLYDHDCESCLETIGEMSGDDRLSDVVVQGKIRVVAIDMAPEESQKHSQSELWAWTRLEQDDLDIQSIYAMRETPSLYLISADGHILLKDVSYGRIANAIFH